jgi:hypothetical protein
MLKNSTPKIRAGAIYIEIKNNSITQPISVLFEGALDANNIVLQPGEFKIFPMLGSQGYAAFTLSGALGGDIESAFVLIIN